MYESPDVRDVMMYPAHPSQVYDPPCFRGARILGMGAVICIRHEAPGGDGVRENIRITSKRPYCIVRFLRGSREERTVA